MPTPYWEYPGRDLFEQRIFEEFWLDDPVARRKVIEKLWPDPSWRSRMLDWLHQEALEMDARCER